MGKFADDTSLEQMGDHRWKAHLQKGWRIGRVPTAVMFGIVGRAISQSLTMQTHSRLTPFIGAHYLGEAEIQVEILRMGKGTQFASARMYQEGSLKVTRMRPTPTLRT